MDQRFLISFDNSNDSSRTKHICRTIATLGIQWLSPRFMANGPFFPILQRDNSHFVQFEGLICIYSNPSKLANFGGKKIGDREFGNRELGCYFTSKKSIWGFSATK